MGAYFNDQSSSLCIQQLLPAATVNRPFGAVIAKEKDAGKGENSPQPLQRRLFIVF